jgi:hypothetical protein
MKSLLTSLFFALAVITATGQPKDRVASTPALGHDWRPGVINITELNAGLGIALVDEPYARNYFGITTVNGYQFTRNIKAGVGLGFQSHNGGVLFPLYLDARYSLNAQKVVPFFAGAGGVLFSFKELTTLSRIFINPSLGLKWVALNKMGLSFSTGLMITSGGGLRDSFVNFKLGAEFKGKEWSR